jgi:MFS transporter, CP family, cyanate transporter
MRRSSAPRERTSAMISGRTIEPSGRMLWPALAVLLVSINLRPAIAAVSPLLDSIQTSTGLSEAGAGFLTTLPLICFGTFAPLAPRLIRGRGVERVLTWVLAVLLAGIALRLAPALLALFAGTFLIGAAVAIANVVVTAVIKRDFQNRIGLMSGLHTTMLLGGAALAGGLTEPIGAGLSLSWRQALAIWGLPVVAALIFWVPKARKRPAPEAGTFENGAISVRGVWKSKVAWAIAGFYAFQSIIYYTVTAWVPSFYVAHGWSEVDSGWLLSLLCVCAIFTAVTVPLLAERSRRHGLLVYAGGVPIILGTVGMIAAPCEAALLWMALLGLGLGAAVSLGITYMSTRARGHREAGIISAMSQCVGYLFAALGPSLFGLSRDLTGNWTAGLVAVAVLAVPMMITGILSGHGEQIGVPVTS